MDRLTHIHTPLRLIIWKPWLSTVFLSNHEKNKTGFCASYFFELCWVHKITHRYFINQKISHSEEEVNHFLGVGKSLSQQCTLIMGKLGWDSHFSFYSCLNKRQPMRQIFPGLCLCPVCLWKNLHSSGPQTTVSAATLCPLKKGSNSSNAPSQQLDSFIHRTVKFWNSFWSCKNKEAFAMRCRTVS